MIVTFFGKVSLSRHDKNLSRQEAPSRAQKISSEYFGICSRMSLFELKLRRGTYLNIGHGRAGLASLAHHAPMLKMEMKGDADFVLKSVMHYILNRR